MAVIHKEKVLLKKLKKQVERLKRKEEHTRAQFHQAMEKVRTLGKTYKKKLRQKARMMKDKIAEVQASAYAEVAAELEDKMLKSLESKARAFASAVAKIDKKHAIHITKSVASKAKKMRKKALLAMSERRAKKK